MIMRAVASWDPFQKNPVVVACMLDKNNNGNQMKKIHQGKNVPQIPHFPQNIPN